MKKRGIFLVFLLLLGCGKPMPFQSVEVDDSKLGIHAEAPGAQSTIHLKITKEQIYKGNLLLVNKTYAIRAGSVAPDVVALARNRELLNGFALLDNTIRLPRSVAQSFAAMVQAADKEGVNHFMISSGYRDEAEQRKLYQDMGPDYALPAGHSEHNLGLSLDIGSSLKEMSQAPEGKWLLKNAWSYGFILRYPKDKTAITGIQYEPWHFRYVGLPHSRIMQERNWTLEEYLDYLSEHKSISATVDGKRYDILYTPVKGAATLSIPAGRRYDLSGNNIDGVIVTIYP